MPSAWRSTVHRTLLRARMVEPLEGVAQAVLRDAQADLARGGGLDGVRLVEHHENRPSKRKPFSVSSSGERSSFSTSAAPGGRERLFLGHRRAQQHEKTGAWLSTTMLAAWTLRRAAWKKQPLSGPQVLGVQTCASLHTCCQDVVVGFARQVR